MAGSEILRDKIVNVRFYTDYPVCNYSCAYCIAGHGNKNGRPESSWDSLRYDAIIDNLCQLDFRINIRIGVGGEFFISKQLVDGARRLGMSENVFSLNLITNLSLSTAQYLKILDGIPAEKIALVASYHPTEVRDRERWLDTAVALSNRYDFSTISVAYPPIIRDLEAIKAMFDAAKVAHFVQPYIGEYEGRHYPQAYTEEERRIIRQTIYSRHDYEFLLNLKRPGLCNAGFKFLYVHSNGVVTPCGGANHQQVLGDLSISPEINFRSGPSPCPGNRCQCDTENVNTVIFENHYRWENKNQHRFVYRFAQEATQYPWMDEWEIPY